MINKSGAGNLTLAAGKRFYGWIAFSGGAFSGMISNGVFIFAYGVFLPVMCADLGWGLAAISLGMTMGYVFFGISSPLVGISVARFGPRINMLFGNILMVLCLAGMSRVTELWQVFVIYSLAGVASNFAGFITTNAVATNWFTRKRALAMGIISGSIGVGGFIIPIIATSSISSIGWRMAWLVLAGIVVIGLISGLLIRNKPEDIGQLPDGVTEEAGLAKVKDLGADSETSSWTVKKALQQPSTWLIMVFMTANFFAWAAMMAHQVSYAESLGATPMAAAMTVSVLAGASIIGGVGFGILALKFSTKRLAIIGFAIYTLSLVILLTVKSLPAVYVYAFLFGMSGGAILPVMSSLLSSYYGRAIFPKILGLLTLFIFPFRAAAPAVPGAIFDATGSYTLAFVILTAFSFVGFILAFLVRPPKQPEPDAKPVASSV
jgi:MFS family permease